ncbi:MAG: tetrahydrofolate dehydrogenase/cyclohydrolase catalytic domain-containing protein, partial [Ignavibacteriales bacterium]
MPLIDGKLIAQELKQGIKNEVENMRLKPVLAIIIVGDDQESQRYVRMKQRAIEEIGGLCQTHCLNQANTDKLIDLVEELNDNPDVHGILVQLPLPSGLDTDRILSSICTTKDVDGFSPLNLGLIFTGQQYFTSCAALGVMHVVDKYAAIPSPRVLLVGDSFDVIKPLANLFIGRGCSVTITPALQPWIDMQLFDVVVIENGEPASIEASCFAASALVIDAGFHWIDEKTCGNVRTADFVGEGSPWLLPVPGGLGPLLITMLMWNLVKAGKLN